ncbi:MAG: IS200/IS605 family transposase [Bacteroidales bacterium]
MPYIKIYIHTVWTTKSRKKLMTKEDRQEIFDHIRENAKKKDIHIVEINGYLEHVHCIISLKQEQNISTVMNLIKGESSYWINKNKLTKTKFAWQDEYFAVSIGKSQLPYVIKYLKNQEKHHEKKSFNHEYDEFIEKYGFEKYEDQE